MVCRLLNAFSDPVIGILSDRTHTKFGQRKPWVIGGGLLLLLTVVAMYMPPAWANGTYLGIGLFLLYLGNSGPVDAALRLGRQPVAVLSRAHPQPDLPADRRVAGAGVYGGDPADP